MENENKIQKVPIYFGVLSIGLGVLLNEYLLVELFSDDGVVASTSPPI